jgi:hypothetical protein
VLGIEKFGHLVLGQKEQQLGLRFLILFSETPKHHLELMVYILDSDQTLYFLVITEQAGGIGMFNPQAYTEMCHLGIMLSHNTTQHRLRHLKE